MGQLQLKYHPILTAKEIFAANKIKLPHADTLIIIILTNRCNILAKGLPPMFLPMAIKRHQKRHKLLKIVIGDGQAAIHTGLANGKIGLD